MGAGDFIRTGRTKGGRSAVPWVMLALWAGVLALASPFAAELAGVQHDRVTDYLPASADSTRVARLQEQLPGGESTELVLVYHRDGGLTAADRTTARDQVARIAGDHVLTGVPRGVPSADGATLMYPVATNEPGTDEDERDAFVEDVRDVAHSRGGLTVEVGGTGALATDAAGVYDSLGGPLLYTTVGVVAVLLILIYRSPVLWLVPLAVAGIADFLSMAVAYGLHQAFGTTVSGQSSGIMTILVFGAGTDYALLLVSRYREELRRVERPYDAMRAALRGCGPAVLASAGTVAAGLLCLLAADLNSHRGMGPLGTVGVLCALVTMLTLLPAILVLLGRRVFWPLVPAHGSTPKARRSLFAAMGTSARRRPRTVLAAGAVLLGALALGTLNLPGTVRQQDAFVDRPESVVAMETLAEAFPEQSARPIDVLTPAGRADAALAAIRDTDGVADARRGRTAHDWTEIAVTAAAPPESAAETATIEALRERLPDSYVGGPSATRERSITISISRTATRTIGTTTSRSRALASARSICWADANIVEALRAGASGFLVKDTRPAELLDAIRTVAAGEALLSPGPTARLIARFLRSPCGPPAVGGPEGLSEREREVLALVARGLTNTEIGETLGLSPLTAKTHVSRIMGKLGARDRAQLVIVAYESGLVTPGRA
ncbi:MMPL family transporter [Streptomyces sp. NBC_00199]|uniref:MMPL family transporter n=1 Tax=Streptomyces sp. NBC_00199 TaxID=2975678 RepID=UPI002257E402|nr:MMPL family transporter [Streptomyces sp. NBC_00199]MCX5263411.1 MMPL family transporter [Streptomyces sp. NBC_00199]